MRRKAKRKEATLYRAVYVDYRNDPLPSRSEEGRFHDTPGTTTYLAGSRATAWKEVQDHWNADPKSYGMAVVSVRLRRIADLTEPSVQARYGIDRRGLTGLDYELCQKLTRRLRAEGFEGLWTFSKADSPGGRQLVIFLDQLQPDSSIRVSGVEPVAA
ncbi:MAG: hypothetical protein A3G20_09220 [Acidobacteria bacterium RIFCSPLOWO2_12_FULL_59_11]|nr:MAG: hypothetical protein A3G20_09220 [Acidobacteria bacterium RIFCSPLOWO2_12_FULL_59_11]